MTCTSFHFLCFLMLKWLRNSWDSYTDLLKFSLSFCCIGIGGCWTSNTTTFGTASPSGLLYPLICPLWNLTDFLWVDCDLLFWNTMSLFLVLLCLPFLRNIHYTVSWWLSLKSLITFTLLSPYATMWFPGPSSELSLFSTTPLSLFLVVPQLVGFLSHSSQDLK